MDNEGPKPDEYGQYFDFGGRVVAAFESRRLDDMVRLIERHGGQARVCESMKELPQEANEDAMEFAHRLLTGEITTVVFLTGVGFSYLLSALEKRVDKQRYLDCLSDITTIARGPKPAAAMNDVGLRPTYRVEEPNTWREILTLVDEKLTVANQVVAVQEYGKANPSLTAGLEARGAQVLSIPIYRWGLPDDCGPLLDNARTIAKGDVDVVLFTSAQQVLHLFEVAKPEGISSQLLEQLKQTVVCSIGPTTSEQLRQLGIHVDLEPSHPHMGHLVRESSQHVDSLIARKKRSAATLSGPHSDANDSQAPWFDSPFLKACRGEPTPFTPVWLMRQAGRYMEEYRQVRAKTTFLELCKNPALCSEVMCTAVDRLGVDAAIIFSDLLPILVPMGMDLEFAKGEGPVIHNPIREPADVDRLRELTSMDELDFVVETVRQTRNDLPADLPLIGFAGAPFTLASYVIEGGASRNYAATKSIMYRDAGAWNALMERFSRAIVLYLNAQIDAGAQCVQLFDSWVGCLGVHDYRRFVLPHLQRIVRGIYPSVPLIHFGTGNPELLPAMAETGATVTGVDWRIGLDEAWARIGYKHAVQGNLDPCALLGSRKHLETEVRRVLREAGGRPGHIFNLGHGILQQTSVKQAIAVVELVHELSAS
ncbi:MAG: uroporphyrinogen decarboxylase [Pirellulaceae bacterium]